MAPARNRNYDDPRLDSSTKDKTQSSAGKARRNPASALASSSTSKSGASGPSATTSTQSTESTGIAWSKESIETIHKYRCANRIGIPLAFQSDYNAAILTMPGVGAQSPTMARRKDKRKVTKDQAALVVRKHFNSQAISESEVVVEFLYKIKMEDQGFKLRFSPQVPR